MCSEGVDLGELWAHLQPGLFRCSDVGACVWCNQLFQALDLLTAPEFAIPVLFGAGWGLRGCCLVPCSTGGSGPCLCHKCRMGFRERAATWAASGHRLVGPRSKSS